MSQSAGFESDEGQHQKATGPDGATWLSTLHADDLPT